MLVFNWMQLEVNRNEIWWKYGHGVDFQSLKYAPDFQLRIEIHFWPSNHLYWKKTISIKFVSLCISFTTQLESSQSHIRREIYDKNTKGSAVLSSTRKRLHHHGAEVPPKQSHGAVVLRHCLSTSRSNDGIGLETTLASKGQMTSNGPLYANICHSLN